MARLPRRDRDEVGRTPAAREMEQDAPDRLGRVMALQGAAGNRAVSALVARQPVDAHTEPGTGAPRKDPHAPMPDWSVTSSAEPLPGEPVPGYEDELPFYKESDRTNFQQALIDREAANVSNVGGFLSEYAASFLELWGTYVTEEMAKASDDSGFGFGAKLFKFIISESLQGIAAAVTGGQSILWRKALSFVVEKAVGFAADLAGDAVEGQVREGQVGEEQKKLDALTAQFGDKLRGMVGDTVNVLGGVAPYGTWLGTAPLEDLGRFRLPPLFPPIPADTVRASVAAAIVGGLQGGEQFVFTDDKSVIVIRVIPGPGKFVAVDTAPGLHAPDKLAPAMRGQKIAGLRGMPLHVTVQSDGPATDLLVAGPGTGPTPADEALEKLGIPMEPPEAHLPSLKAAYPIPAPTTITRSADGNVGWLGGGLIEHLYLAKRINPDLTLAGLVRDVTESAYQDELRAAEEGVGESSRAPAPEDVALGIFRQLFSLVDEGARNLITETIEGMPA